MTVSIKIMLDLTVFGAFLLFADLKHQSHVQRHQMVQERGRKRSREMQEERGKGGDGMGVGERRDGMGIGKNSFSCIKRIYTLLHNTDHK